jgi:hypothetical protein
VGGDEGAHDDARLGQEMACMVGKGTEGEGCKVADSSGINPMEQKT